MIGRIVYLGFSRDEAYMGFAFPKEERDALVASDPDEVPACPGASELRYNWVVVRLDAIDARGDAGARGRRVAHGRARSASPPSTSATDRRCATRAG